ncbi:MAG TPA: efflux RND transporter periplasmic adaptor subunit [Chitinophagaceae bacterium]|nr:efflux RND transporter periplasmic adaptor subunit [Chitinophagaceae bacterium]
MKAPKYTFLLLFLFAMAACQHENTKQNTDTKDTILVNVIPVKKDTFSPIFKTSGYFTTNNETPLSFKNGGIVSHLYVKQGDRIKKGQLLATIYAAEVNAATKQANLALKKAKRDYQRAVDLYHDSVATLEQMQNAKTALAVAKQQKKAAAFNKKHSEIKALNNGFILESYLREGQTAAPGQPVFLVNSTTSNGWIFKSAVSDYQWATLKIGDKAMLTTNAAPNQKLQAKVFKKSKSVDSKTGSFTVQLAIENSKNISFATGLFGKATLYPSLQLSGWNIPYDALLDADRDSGFVFITNDKKEVKKQKVHISKIKHGTILIDSGLEDAKFLITTGSPYLKDGSNIKVSK